MSSHGDGSLLVDDPLWYRDAIIYQTHVRAFFDSTGDGMGDFRGLTAKLHYLEELGVNTIWILPFYPSPLKDDGYDIADYTNVHPAYGTIQDFTHFLRAAHRRGMRVITELVINHTSDQHPWFRRARRSPPGSRERDFYVWSDTPQKYPKARIIFKDFEPSNWTIDSVAGAYYWHRFYAHQPDLNFDSPDVHKAVFQVLDFWMRRGVDGVRLDAVPYLYEREGTSCENLPETHAFLKELRRYLDSKYRNRMILAEANQWPDDAAAYFGAGDECHMNFHFPIMPRMFMAIRMEDRFPIVDIMQQTPAIPRNCQWATFLRNHDELTLEMVTDRERDYMYQAYARDREMRVNLGIRRRLAPLLSNDRRAIELMNGLLFSMPGSPVIYYGDEIGMGDNVYLGDRNGVRTPMQWSSDRNAGFSRANPQRLYLPVIIDPQFHYESVNVEAQENTPQSLLWWMRRLIGLRKRLTALGRGTLEFIPCSNRRVLSLLRQHGDQQVLVVANLSRFAQQVELDLSRFRGVTPVEAFGWTRFRPVGAEPYYLSLSPYAFYWFALEPHEVTHVSTARCAIPLTIAVGSNWESVLEGRARAMLERSFPEHWNNLHAEVAADQKLESIKIVDTVRWPLRTQPIHLALVQVEYRDASLGWFAVPLSLAAGEAAQQRLDQSPETVIARLTSGGGELGVLYDAIDDQQYVGLLLQLILRRRRLAGREMELAVSIFPDALKHLPDDSASVGRIIKSKSRRITAAVGDEVLLKIYRRLVPGINPDLEVGRFLTQRGFAHAPATLAALEIRRPDHEALTLAIIRHYVPHQQTAWEYTLEALGQYFEQAVTKGAELRHLPTQLPDPLTLAREETPEIAREILGFYLTRAALLGRRTGELHLALASDSEDPAFCPEPFTPFYQRSQYQALLYLHSQAALALRNRLTTFPADLQADAQAVLDAEDLIQQRFRELRDRRCESLRIRCHGNYHLGQLLFTGKDFVITDFEGDPEQFLSERRAKYSALRDVAGMLRSFHYAAYASLLAETEGTLPAGRAQLEPWYRLWQAWTPATFLRSYLDTVRGSPVLPANEPELRTLLEVKLLQEALGEVLHELENRPAWVRVPLQGILQIVNPPRQTAGSA